MRAYRPLFQIATSLFLGIMVPLNGHSSGADPLPALKNPFGQRLARSLEYIDYPDILVAVAAGNPEPWTRYDRAEAELGRKTPLEQRWNRALLAPLSGSIDQQLETLFRIFSEDATGGIRTVPIDDAGGDLLPDASGHGYDRLTQDELKNLVANPVLTVETRADPDSSDGSTVLARYRYPSAATWRKFASLLSPELALQLQNAEKSGALQYDIQNRESVGSEFRRLNGLLLRELLRRAYVSTDPPEANYQRLMSVHPFPDYNGRSLRVWYQKQKGAPLFLRNFYCDLYCSQAEFSREAARGYEAYALLLRGLAAEEAQRPGSPLFYDIVEFWAVAADSTQAPLSKDAWVRDSKQWWLRWENARRVDQKQFDDVLRDYRSFSAPYLGRSELRGLLNGLQFKGYQKYNVPFPIPSQQSA